jgi:hypothetical protein
VKGYTVSGQHFRTQQELVAYVRGILNRYHVGQPLDLFDYPFMLDLLQRHPDAAQKIGCGASAIYVAETPPYRTRCFFLIREDGSETDFSYLECIRATPYATQVRLALRAAIDPQILACKEAAFATAEWVSCPDTGERLVMATAHVDHRAPLTFERLVEQFLAREGLDFDDIAVIPSADLTYHDELSDPALRSRWVQYHQEHAQLEIVSLTANLSLRNRGNGAPTLPPGGR